MSLRFYKRDSSENEPSCKFQDGFLSEARILAERRNMNPLVAFSSISTKVFVHCALVRKYQRKRHIRIK